MNPHVRDNLLAVGPHLIVRKSADESVTSSTTLQDDNHLILPVVANEIYRVEFLVIFSGANSTGDIKIAFTFPSGGRIDVSALAANTSGTFSTESYISSSTSPTAGNAFNGRGTSVRVAMPIVGIFTTGGTGGNLTLQWAQNTSSGTATTVYANSTLYAVKLA
jgi:hypothetical protein